MKQSMNMGGSGVSRNILEKNCRMKWCFREESIDGTELTLVYENSYKYFIYRETGKM